MWWSKLMWWSKYKKPEKRAEGGGSLNTDNLSIMKKRIEPIKDALDTDLNTDNLKKLADAETPDGRNILEALYGFKFDIGNSQHTHILQNILLLIRTEGHESGRGIDIDSGKIMKVPLFCRSVDDLIQVYRNQIAIYEGARSAIIEYYQLPKSATYASSILMRQIVADIEARIKTNFRTELPTGTLNIDSWERESQQLTWNSPDKAIDHLQRTLAIVAEGAIPPIQELYDLQGVPIRGGAIDKMIKEFVPAGGGNII